MNRTQTRAVWRNRIHRENGQLRPAAIRVCIGEVHVSGIAGPRHRIAGGLSRQLTSLLLEHGVPSYWKSFEMGSTPKLELGPGMGAMQVGEGLAHALFQAREARQK